MVTVCCSLVWSFLDRSHCRRSLALYHGNEVFLPSLV